MITRAEADELRELAERWVLWTELLSPYSIAPPSPGTERYRHMEAFTARLASLTEGDTK